MLSRVIREIIIFQCLTDVCITVGACINLLLYLAVFNKACYIFLSSAVRGLSVGNKIISLNGMLLIIASAATSKAARQTNSIFSFL